MTGLFKRLRALFRRGPTFEETYARDYARMHNPEFAVAAREREKSMPAHVAFGRFKAPRRPHEVDQAFKQEATTLLERFDARCEQLRSAQAVVERDQGVRLHIGDEHCVQEQRIIEYLYERADVAGEVLVLRMDAEAVQRFIEMLHATPEPNPGVERLMKVKPSWKKE